MWRRQKLLLLRKGQVGMSQSEKARAGRWNAGKRGSECSKTTTRSQRKEFEAKAALTVGLCDRNAQEMLTEVSCVRRIPGSWRANKGGDGGTQAAIRTANIT